MADIINERVLDGSNADEVGTLDDLATSAAPAEPKTPPKPEDELPDKYRGKSLVDIVRMHQEAEKVLGRQSSEVGELRKVVDDFITKQTELVTTKKNPPEEVDFFADPNKAVSQAIDAHPALAEVRQLTQAQRQSAAQAEMLRRHPDANELVANDKFMEWVMASKVRQALLVRADQQFDVDAADELFSTWKERQGLIAQTVNVEQGARREAVRRAATGGGTSTPNTSSKKKYRRADIINLMQNDPDRYEALAPEIRQAYVEGRVI